jgi:hypothetical protein
MNHPLRTLLRELFADPILRLLRIRGQERLDTLPRGTRDNATQMPTVQPNPTPC